MIDEMDFHTIAEKLAGRHVDNLIPCNGGRNSRVYKVVCGHSCFAMKQYPANTGDAPSRLDSEIKALRFYEDNHNAHVPRIFAVDNVRGFALLEWIEGSSVKHPSVKDIRQALDFLADTHAAEVNGGNNFGLATEPCLCGKDLVAHLHRRLERFEAVLPKENELRRFLKQHLLPLMETAIALAKNGYSTFSTPLAIDSRSLIPADFGFHNALKAPDGNLCFIDFEHFGWDDPVRLAADFLLHPGMELNEGSREYFRRGMISIYSADTQFEQRLIYLLPLYGIRWSLILLNEFLPDRWQARIFAGETADWAEIKKAQLEKACKTLDNACSCLALV